MDYLIFKLIHVMAVIVFLGNIALGLFWKLQADRSKNPAIIRHTMAGIIRSDQLFTVPSVFIILIGGVGAAIQGGFPILRTGWIFWAIVLFSMSGFAFMARLVPLQRELYSLAEAGEKAAKLDWDLYKKLSRQWELWGGVALIAPAVAAVLMILKPSLPGL